MKTLLVSSKKQHKKIILTSIAVGAAGVLGYFGWRFYQKKRQLKNAGTSDGELDTLLKTAPAGVTTSIPDDQAPTQRAGMKFKPRGTALPPSATSNNSSSFPLKKGSQGTKVRLVQKALIAKYGKAILPKYGADGHFGSELIAALRKVGLSTTINESTYNVLTQSLQADGVSIGTTLYRATVNQDFSAVLAGLQQISNTAAYTMANDAFKSKRIHGVRQTIVNALLHAFPKEEEQQQIKFEFLRIGLQFNGNSWSLSGLGGLPIITVQPAPIWTNSRSRLLVPARVVLGNEVSKRLDYTLFENQGQYFLVPTRCVRYI